MKKIIILSLVFLVLSCAKNQENKTAEQPESVVNTTDTEKKETPDRSQLNHLYSANGGSILYLKNGEVKSCARCDFDGDFIGQLQKLKTAYRYKDYDNYAIANGNDTIRFFEDLTGRIESGWKIIKGIPITHEMSVISYSEPEKNKKSTTITDTQLVILEQETRTFADENSPEADAYFTASDDYGWYLAELTESFEKRHIKVTSLKNRFVTFPIENNQKITIDTYKLINNNNVSVLLYKKNKRPIIVHLIPDENAEAEIKTYLEE